jgi:hypothetical protein
MRRPPGTGQIYEKWGAYYARWRTPDGRRLNRKLGPARTKGAFDGLTRAQAERAFRRIQAEEASRKPVTPVVETVTVDQAADRLRERITIEGARLSYRQNCESMQRVHISPALGRRKVAAARTSSGWRAGCSRAGPRQRRQKRSGDRSHTANSVDGARGCPPFDAAVRLGSSPWPHPTLPGIAALTVTGEGPRSGAEMPRLGAASGSTSRTRTA